MTLEPGSGGPAPRDNRARTATRQRRLLLFGCVVLYAWFIHFWPTFQAANESIRLYAVQALVDHGSLSVDPVLERYGMGNVDRAIFEGKAYLDKAPGLSLLVLPAYALLTGPFGMSTEFVALPVLSWLLLLFGVVVPAALGIAWCYRLVEAWTGDPASARLAAGVLALGSPYALYATLFFGHAPAAASVMGLLWFGWRQAWVRAGLLGGAAALFDTAVLPLVIALSLGLAWRSGAGQAGRARAEAVGHAALMLFVGALPFAAIQLGWNTALFDDPFTFAYAHKATGQFADIHEKGLYGIALPTWESLWGLSFGAQRGVFFHAPVLLVGLLGLAWLRPPTGTGARFDWRFGIVLGGALLHFLFIAGFGDWRAGASYAPRHLVPLVPLLAASIGLAMHRLRTGRFSWLTAVVPALLVISVALNWMPLATFPYAPEAFDVPTLQLAAPMMRALHLSPNVGQWLGLSESLSVWPAVVVLGLVLGGLVLRGVGSTPQVVVSALLGLAVVFSLLAMTPEPTNEHLAHRSLIECLMDHPERGKALCESHDGRWNERACHCRRR